MENRQNNKKENNKFLLQGYWREGIDGIMRRSSTSPILCPNILEAFFIGLRKEDNITDEDVQSPNFQRFLNEWETLIPRLTVGAFGKMLDLAFNIKRSESTNFHESIIRKMQETFLGNVEKILAGHNKDIQILVSIAKYMDSNIQIIHLNILEAFSNALLRINEKPRNIHDSVSIIVLFSNFGALGAQSESALNEMIKLWIQFNPTLEDVEMLLFLLSKNRTIQDKQVFEESHIIRFSLTFLSGKNNKIVLSCYEHLMKMVIFFQIQWTSSNGRK